MYTKIRLLQAQKIVGEKGKGTKEIKREDIEKRLMGRRIAIDKLKELGDKEMDANGVEIKVEKEKTAAKAKELEKVDDPITGLEVKIKKALAEDIEGLMCQLGRVLLYGEGQKNVSTDIS